MYKKLGMYLVYQKFGNNQTLLAGIIQVFRMVFYMYNSSSSYNIGRSTGNIM